MLIKLSVKTFRVTVMCGCVGVGRTIDGITDFRRHRLVLIALRGIAEMGFGLCVY
jgi:hypothetical protein